MMMQPQYPPTSGGDSGLTIVLVIGGVTAADVGGYYLYNYYVTNSTTAPPAVSTTTAPTTTTTTTPTPAVPVGGERVVMDQISEGGAGSARCAVPAQYPVFDSLTYGANGKFTTDVTRLNSACSGQNPCSFTPGNSLFGDPIPGTAKAFKGSFICKGN